MPGTTLFGAPARFDADCRISAVAPSRGSSPTAQLGESNAGLLVGDGASLLVDTLWDVPLTRRMLAAMEPHLAGAPVETLVNTHSDGDHWWGNQLLAARRIVTSDAAAAVMARPASASCARCRSSGRRSRWPAARRCPTRSVTR